MAPVFNKNVFPPLIVHIPCCLLGIVVARSARAKVQGSKSLVCLQFACGTAGTRYNMVSTGNKLLIAILLAALYAAWVMLQDSEELGSGR